MDYQSTIVKELRFLADKFASLQVSHSTELLQHYGKLSSEKQDAYINQYEHFFYVFGIFDFIVNDLLLIVSKLEDIRKERDQQIKMERGLSTAFLSDSSTSIFHLTTWFFNAIAILVQNSQENIPKMNLKKMLSDYPEIMYINSLRNEFLQHPKSQIPFHLVSTSHISGSDQLIPYASIGPGGGGLTMLTKHHLNKIKDANFLKLDSHAQLASNKKKFADSSHLWQRGQVDDALIHKIKAVGLPAYDQRILARELRELFTSVVLPFVLAEYEKAKDSKIILTP